MHNIAYQQKIKENYFKVKDAKFLYFHCQYKYYGQILKIFLSLNYLTKRKFGQRKNLSCGFISIFTNTDVWLFQVNDCPAGLEPPSPAGANNRRKASVKIRRNPPFRLILPKLSSYEMMISSLYYNLIRNNISLYKKKWLLKIDKSFKIT